MFCTSKNNNRTTTNLKNKVDASKGVPRKLSMPKGVSCELKPKPRDHIITLPTRRVMLYEPCLKLNEMLLHNRTSVS